MHPRLAIIEMVRSVNKYFDLIANGRSVKR